MVTDVVFLWVVWSETSVRLAKKDMYVPDAKQVYD